MRYFDRAKVDKARRRIKKDVQTEATELGQLYKSLPAEKVNEAVHYTHEIVINLGHARSLGRGRTDIVHAVQDRFSVDGIQDARINESPHLKKKYKTHDDIDEYLEKNYVPTRMEQEGQRVLGRYADELYEIKQMRTAVLEKLGPYLQYEITDALLNKLEETIQDVYKSRAHPCWHIEEACIVALQELLPYVTPDIAAGLTTELAAEFRDAKEDEPNILADRKDIAVDGLVIPAHLIR
jgi:hypothetical protein